MSTRQNNATSDWIYNDLYNPPHYNLLNVDDPSLVFKKRSGTTDEGGQFEDLYLAYLLLNLVKNEKIEKFNVWSNHPDFGAMDDVVFDVISSDDKLNGKYAVQLKYANTGGILTKQALTAKKGDFSILKYFEEYRKKSETSGTFHFFLVTNRKFDIVKDEITIEKSDEVKFVVKIKKVKSNNHVKFTVKDRGPPEFDDFFKHFTLITNHESVDQVKDKIKDIFKSRFSCQDELVYRKYTEFVEKWSKNTSLKTTLHSSFIKHAIALMILSPSAEFLQFGEKPMDKKATLLRKSISKFDVTFLSGSACQGVKNFWHHLTTRQSVNTREYLRKARQYQIFRPSVGSFDDLNDEEWTKFLWLMGECPLIVKDNDATQKAICLCEKKKFIVANAESSTGYSTFRVFRSLLDLKKRNSTLFKRVSSTFTCSIQGKAAIKLNELIDKKGKILDILNVDKLVEMLDHELLLGRPEDLPPSPIFRFLSKNIVKYKIFSEVNLQETLIVISCLNTTYQLIVGNRLPDITLITMDQFLTEQNIKLDRFVVVCENDISKDEFSILCGKVPRGCVCHHLRHIYSTGLEWVRSSPKIDNLNNFLEDKATLFIAESKLMECEDESSVNIVVGDPGMGKTTLLKTLQNNSPPSIWSILIYVRRDHSSYFREGGDDTGDFKTYIFNTIEDQSGSFDSKVAEVLAGEGRVKYFWDGLDELSDVSFKTARNIINNLSKVDGSKHWMTSRCHLRQNLENHFNVLSRTMRKLSDFEQKKYLRNRIECSGEEVDEIFAKIKNNIQLFPHNDVMGIPLLLYMLTELVRKDQRKYKILLNKVFSIADLYKYFVEEKFNVYFRDKEGVGDPKALNDIVYQRITDEKYQRIDYYKKSSLKLYFEDDVLQTSTEVTKIRDPIGFIINTSAEFGPEFFHNSFGEYFAALYLAEHWEKTSHIPNFTFDEKYYNIRFFLDLILAKNSPVHRAVLYRNPHLLEDCQNDQFLCRDESGRSALEVACSWCENYQPLDVKNIKNKYVVSKPPFSKKDPAVNRTILDFLITKYTNEELKEILNCDSRFYGSTRIKLLPIILLTKATNTKTQKFQDNVFTILRYCISFDYDDLINICQELHLMESFSQLLIQHGSRNIIRQLRRSENFDSFKSYDHDFVKGACLRKDEVLLRFLIDEGVRLDTLDEDGKTPIHYVCQTNNWSGVILLLQYEVKLCLEDYKCKSVLHRVSKDNANTVEWLIRGGALVNFRDKFGKTPLHYACKYGYSSVAKILVERGARTDVVDNHRKTSIFVAYSRRRNETFEALLEVAGPINLTTKSGASIIHDACERGFYDILKILVNQHVSLDVVDKSGEMPIHTACRQGHFDIVKLLIDAGQSLNVVNKYKQLPIHLASEEGHYAVVELLIDKGSRINVVDKYHQTPLQLAYQNKHSRVVELLIDKSSIADKFALCSIPPDYQKNCSDVVNFVNDVDHCLDKEGAFKQMLLRLACAKGHLEVVRLLIEKGVELNAVDENGEVPLHEACRNRHYKIVKLLTDKGASLCVVNKYGLQPVDYAGGLFLGNTSQ
ncbi:hypothetical protein Zmor_016103 [Zophobas morio]|uniref:Uncharacterized protein n=1 Tax=Zophobas morio TaxID=2755281 RepID=A0AA38INC2_9CUCU|nr:hypothetical protein Zmor_016103 [Zophobas morio]